MNRCSHPVASCFGHHITLLCVAISASRRYPCTGIFAGPAISSWHAEYSVAVSIGLQQPAPTIIGSGCRLIMTGKVLPIIYGIRKYQNRKRSTSPAVPCRSGVKNRMNVNANRSSARMRANCSPRRNGAVPCGLLLSKPWSGLERYRSAIGTIGQRLPKNVAISGGQ